MNLGKDIIKKIFPAEHLHSAVVSLCSKRNHVDLLLVTKSANEFHKVNISKACNRKDYTFFNKVTFNPVQNYLMPKTIPLNFIQSHFANVSFNNTSIDLKFGHLRMGETTLRYGVVQQD